MHILLVLVRLAWEWISQKGGGQVNRNMAINKPLYLCELAGLSRLMPTCSVEGRGTFHSWAWRKSSSSAMSALDSSQ